MTNLRSTLSCLATLAVLITCEAGCSSDGDGSSGTTNTVSDARQDDDVADDPDVSEDDADVTGADVDAENDTTEVSGGCVDDGLDNTTPGTAAPATNQTDLVICPDAPDYYRIALEEGDTLSVEVTFVHSAAGDIDLYLYEEGAVTDDDILDASESEGNSEQLVLSAEDGAITYILEVWAWKVTDGEDGASYSGDGTNTYSITFTSVQGCDSDDECESGVCNVFDGFCGPYVGADCGGDGDLDPNDTDSNAYVLAVGADNTTAEVTGLNACSEDIDLFRVTVAAGDSVTFEVEWTATDAVGFMAGFDADFMILENLFVDGDAPSMTLQHAPAGEYIIMVRLFPEEESQPSESAYTLSVEYTAGGCAGFDDCTDSPFGAICGEDGTCMTIIDDGGVALFGACDSNDDCAGFDPDADEPDIACFGAGADPAGWRCLDVSTDCSLDGVECESTEFCQLTQYQGVCVPPCEGDNFCPEHQFCFDADGEAAGIATCMSRECQSDDECAGRPVCAGDLDPSCRPAGEVCNATQFAAGVCSIPNPPGCAGGDDNDRDATATEITLTANAGSAGDSVTICDQDVDVYTVDTTGLGVGNLRASLHWIAAEAEVLADLDAVLAPEGESTFYGVAALSTSEAGDAVEELYGDLVAPGRYYIRVLPYEGVSETPLAYELDINFFPLAGDDLCGVATCDDTSPLRIDCTDDGACIPLEVETPLAFAETCDSNDDCDEGERLSCAIGRISDTGELVINMCSVPCTDSCDIAGATCDADLGWCVPE